MAVYDLNGNALTSVYDVNGSELQDAFDISGESVFDNAVVDYSNYAITDYCSVSLSPIQGFDIHNGIIFQFMGSSNVSNRMATINAGTSAIINNNIPATSEHGDSASFSNQFYSVGDEYPLLYVTSDTNPAKVYINRVTTASSNLIKTLSFPLNKTGYYAAACCDFPQKILYMVGYSEQNYQTDDGGNNKTVISKWDLLNLTDNGDNTYTPAFISSIERPFIYVMQGQQFHDGMLWISSGASNTRGYIYALDPSDGTLLYTVDTNSTTELEGIAFISSTEMVFGLQGGTYKKVTFATVT